jgi:lipopolysaccharide export LptBFGC system permease protein LptF
MRSSRTLSRYLAREIVQYALLGFAAVTLVLVTQNLLRRMDVLTKVGFTIADLGVVLRCLFPMLTAYAIPIALLFGTAIAIRRLVSDGEVLAMRACGISVQALLVPTLILGVLVSGISGYLLVVVEHEARRELIRLFNSVAARGSILQAGEFRAIGASVVFVAERDRNNRLGGVVISDQMKKRPFLILAESGQFSLDEETATIHLQLGEGELHMNPTDEEPDRYQRVKFGAFDYSIDVSMLLSGATSRLRPKQMTLVELRDAAAAGRAGRSLHHLAKQEPILYELEIQRRFALPVAPLLFALAAVPLALRGAPKSRAWGPVLSVILAFGYYAVLTFFQFLAREAWLVPMLAFWIPNACLLAFSIQQLRRLQSGVPT